MERATCMRHGNEELSMRCRQCEIELFSKNISRKVFGEVEVGDRYKDLVDLAEEYLESLDFAAAYTSKTQEVFDAGKVLAAAILLSFKEPEEPRGEITVRPAKKEPFKVNAWHKPPND